jgi:hypothetical protein
MFKSKAQLAKFAEMVKRGQMTKEDFHKWLDATPSLHNLPERKEKPKPFKVGKVRVIK